MFNPRFALPGTASIRGCAARRSPQSPHALLAAPSVIARAAANLPQRQYLQEDLAPI